MLTLATWRRTVAELYAHVRHTAATDPEAAWQYWRQQRDQLFAAHPQSPIDAEQRHRFQQLPYYPYDPAYHLIAHIDTDVEPQTFQVILADDGLLRYTRIARARFRLRGQDLALSLFWIEGYGGGIFLPFRDATNGQGSYGGGRYLYDTIKGADLGVTPDHIVLDFNFAYNPSCAYNPTWVCPLSPPENTLSIPILAGEMAFA